MKTNQPRCLVLLFSFLCFSFYTFGVNQVDSLKQLLNTKKGEERFQILEKLGNFYSNNNLDSSNYYITELKNTAIKAGNIKYEAVANSSLAIYHYYKGNSFEAIDYIKKAIELHKQVNDSVNLADSYNILAGIYGENGHYSKSIEFLSKAIEIFKARDDLLSMVAAYNNLGFLYMELENYEKAINYYKEAISIIDKNDFNKHKGFLYNNLGICYKNTEKYKDALYYYQKALAEYKKYKMKNAIPKLYLNIGIVYGFRLINQDSALYYFERGIELGKKDDVNSLAGFYNSLGLLYKNKKQYNKSIYYLLNALSAAEDNKDLKGQIDAQIQLSEVKSNTNNYREALDHYKQYTLLKDSTEAKKTEITIAQLEEKFENYKKNIIIKQLKIEQKAAKQFRFFMVAGIIFLFAVLCFIVFILFQRRKRHIIEQKLLMAEKQTAEEELKFKTKQLVSQALIMVQKNKMLRELFDSIKAAQKEPASKLPQFLTIFRNKINQNLKSEKEWELFKLYFEQINKTFFDKLKEINSLLTQGDLRLAALIKLKLNIKEAALVLNLSPTSVKSSRSRLRSKLKLDNSEDLATFIESID